MNISVQELPPVAVPVENPLGGHPGGYQEAPRPHSAWDGTTIAELLADEWCSQAVLVFLATTDVGRTSGLPVADGDAEASEASEWEDRERE